ncbi:MAG: MBL fold metallo-hydrolase [Candidatus Sericytochromatia bacterium]
MADSTRIHAENIPGDWYVDLRCIDCGTCRHLAPTIFGEFAAYAGVVKQPDGEAELRQATRALLSCPTGSIGTRSKSHLADVKDVIQDFPLEMAPNVYYCGFAAEESFGASSWLIRHPDGNWLIDAPRYVSHLVEAIEALGGLRWIFLTHRDDVGEAERFAAHFGAERIIHSHEKSAQPEAEHFLKGTEPVPWGEEFLIIPTPGHTRGHCVLLHKNYLFTGDHLWWNRSRKRLGAGHSVCWYSWSEQTRSMAKLQDYSFDWILPGHGAWVHLAQDQMQAQLKQVVEWMEQL